ncbi:tubulin polyglutamylase complex subunit 1-like [Antedon mediterranea]|uniref:tubulin polyglutamylase complex subunit 1-like n=1 Tax=Antedon mediterranea TaxID=105859 RepID=UPI003AF523B5
MDRSSSSSRRQSSRNEKEDSDKEFLEKNGVTKQMRYALTKLVENQPEDALGFLAQHFENMDHKSNRIRRAYQELTLSHYSRVTFESNVIAAYDILYPSTAQKKGKMFSGTAFHDLLSMICKDVPSVQIEKLIKKICCRDYEVVSFQIFHSGVLACFVFTEYISETTNLYKVMDINASNSANRCLCTSALKQLACSLAIPSSTQTYVLEAGSMLGSKELEKAMNSAIYLGKDQGSIMKLEEFVDKSASVYIDNIKPLR